MPKLMLVLAALTLSPLGDAAHTTVEEPPATSARTGTSDVRALLDAARGLAPAICAMAADGASGWGGGLRAPVMPIPSDVRSRMYRSRNPALTADEKTA